MTNLRTEPQRRSVKSMRTLLFLTLLSAMNMQAKNIFVSPEGRDNGKGTIEDPVKSLIRASKMMSPGDTCYLRGGRYYEPFVFHDLVSKGKPMVFAAWNNEKVVFDGTVPVEGKWVNENGIYKVKLKEDVWQLFADGNMLTAARWPNISMEDDMFWNQKISYRKVGPESSFGKTVDQRPVAKGASGKNVKDEGALEIGGVLPEGVNVQSLAQTKVDMTGAVAIMNIGSWFTWAQFIDKHSAGSNEFTYSTDFYYQSPAKHWGKSVEDFSGDPKFWEIKNTKTGQGHYFIEGKQCLDVANEWWYDKKDKELLVKLPDGKKPQDYELRGKHLDYSLKLNRCSNLVFDGIDFYASTFYLNDCFNVTIKNSNLLYPSYSKRVLGELGPLDVTTIKNSPKNQLPTNNSLINCVFEKFDGSALVMTKGKGGVLENILIHDGDYSCIGRGMLVNVETCENLLLKRFTVYNTGSAQTLKVGDKSRVTLCNFYNVGVFQHDGAPIQCGYFTEMCLDHNWSHDHGRHAYRFDGHGGPPVPYSSNGAIHHNVAWNTGQLQVKGDIQAVYNNTLYNTFGTCLLLWEKMNGFHTKSVMANNITPNFKTRWWGKTMPPFPGKLGVNFLEDKSEVKIDMILRDPDNGDFRPKSSSSQIIDKGNTKDVAGHVTYNRNNFEVVGKAVDLGAYEYGCKNYWIPGYQFDTTSTPVPFDNSVKVKKDADLMWLTAYKSNKSVIYFSDNKEEVTNADRKSASCKGEFANNIFTPGKLAAGKTYYWRADAIMPDGKVIKGNIWKFTVE